MLSRTWIMVFLHFLSWSNILPTPAGVGHQRTESTNTGCNQWLSLVKIALKVPLLVGIIHWWPVQQVWGGYKSICNPKSHITITRGPSAILASFWRWTPWTGADKLIDTYLLPHGQAPGFPHGWLELYGFTWIVALWFGGSDMIGYTGNVSVRWIEMNLF
jgi:hypothetical protein